MPGHCEGKTAIVTGASRGIGAAIAMRLAQEGARVVATARTLEPDPRQPGSLADTVAAIHAAGGEAVPVSCDLSRPADRQRLIGQALDRFGTVDILVNDAAVTYLLPADDFPEKRFKLMVELQLWAPFDLIQLVLPGMRTKGAGWILNISSRAGVHPVGPPFEEVHKKGGWSAYGVVKAGLNRLTTALAAELYDAGIAVNSLAPWDNVATPGAGHHDLVENFGLEDPEVMAEAAVALCSGDPRTLTGRVAYSQPLLAELQLRPGGR
jgi:citronellol/citronellal dehydrogenase